MSSYPSKMGPYRVIRRLGVGGMAETLLATKQGPGDFEQQLCIKRILDVYVDSQEFVNAFFEDARIVSQLRHANIVQLYDFGEIDNQYFLALELIDGLDFGVLLKRLIKQGQKLPLELLLVVAYDIAQALDHAHHVVLSDGSLGVIHRDISPGNILISASGEAKLTDFGIAKTSGQERVTQTGVVKGKMSYMSPEQAQAKMLDHRSDLFSFGVVLFEAVAGVRPFDGKSSASTMLNIVQNQRREFSDFELMLPETVRFSIEKLLAPFPEQRFLDASEFVESMFEKVPSIADRRALGKLVRELKTDQEQHLDGNLFEGGGRLEKKEDSSLKNVSENSKSLTPASQPLTTEQETAVEKHRKNRPRFVLLLAVVFSVCGVVGGIVLFLKKDESRIHVNPQTELKRVKDSLPNKMNPDHAINDSLGSAVSIQPLAAPIQPLGGQAQDSVKQNVKIEEPSGSVSESDQKEGGLNKKHANSASVHSSVEKKNKSQKDKVREKPKQKRSNPTKNPKTESTKLESQREIESTSSKKTTAVHVVPLPWGRVWVDGVPYGRGPLKVKVSPGNHLVAVGFEKPTFSKMVNIQNAEVKRVIMQVEKKK